MITISSNAAQVAKQLDISTRQLRVIMEDALEEVNQGIVKDFERITRTWDHKPDFEVITETRRGRVESLVGTDDKIFGYLEHGTRKNYPIRPKRAKALRFMSGFRPKTTIGGLQSGAGGSFGDVIFRRGVIHPGIKARKWMPKIQQRAEKRARKVINKHIARWAKRTGHK